MSLAFMAGYGVRAFLIAQSLNQIDKAYGHNHAILDNCHVRVAFATNDERTAKRMSDALGTATELRAQKNCRASASGLAVAHLDVRAGDATAAADRRRSPAAAAGRRRWCWSPAAADPRQKLRYYKDRNFLERRLAAPKVAAGACDRRAAGASRTIGRVRPRGTDERLDPPLVGAGDGGCAPMTTRRAPARSRSDWAKTIAPATCRWWPATTPIPRRTEPRAPSPTTTMA